MDPTKGDSQLVIDQIKGTGEAKDPQMVKYLGKSQELIKKWHFSVVGGGRSVGKLCSVGHA
jgi:hypothetical protein